MGLSGLLMVGIVPSRCKNAGKNPNQREVGLVTVGAAVSVGEGIVKRASGVHWSWFGGGSVRACVSGTDVVGVAPSRLALRGTGRGSSCRLGMRSALSEGRVSTDFGRDMRDMRCVCDLLNLRGSRAGGDDSGDEGSLVTECSRGPRTAESIEDEESRRLRTGRRTWRRVVTRFRGGCRGGSGTSGSGCTVVFHSIRSHL